jgi:bla regulator protein BlaR1
MEIEMCVALFRKRVLSLAAVCVFTSGIGAYSQTSGAKVSASKPMIYDVSTVKPNETGSGTISISTSNETFYGTNVTLKMMVENAYGIRQQIIFGLPSWAESKHFDIIAKVSDVDKDALKNLTREERQQMLQQFLADRFHLKAHIEMKDLPTYDLVVAKGGIKFKEVAKDAPDDKRDSMSVNNTVLTAYGVPMESLTKMLEGPTERDVIDKTGLTGSYDLNLKWRRDQDTPSAEDDAVPGLFAALEEQLGLKLQSSRGPTKTLVVDHIETATEN